MAAIHALLHKCEHALRFFHEMPISTFMLMLSPDPLPGQAGWPHWMGESCCNVRQVPLQLWLQLSPSMGLHLCNTQAPELCQAVHRLVQCSQVNQRSPQVILIPIPSDR